MSSKVTRSLNAVQAVRASVTEKVGRDAAGPKPEKAGPEKSGPEKSGPGKSGPAKSGSSGSRPKPQRGGAGSGQPAKKATPTARLAGMATSKRRQKGPSAPAAARSTKVVIARVDPFSVLKLSVVFYLSLALALFVAGVILWTVARSSGLVANVESLVADVGFTDFRLRTGPLLGASALASAVLVVTGSLANLLMALLYNLLGGVVGGLKVVLVQVRDKPKR